MMIINRRRLYSDYTEDFEEYSLSEGIEIFGTGDKMKFNET